MQIGMTFLFNNIDYRYINYIIHSKMISINSIIYFYSLNFILLHLCILRLCLMILNIIAILSLIIVFYYIMLCAKIKSDHGNNIKY